ncbi:MAG TPA: hypothetical protein VHB48_05530, partial [Chitinophagaceae bacterium]|nr:hypothetical protein [Chitinophagaceae bacterium]
SVAYSAREAARWARLLVYISVGMIAALILICFAYWDFISRELYFQGGEAARTILVVVWGLIAAIYITFLVLLFIFSNRVLQGLNEDNIEKVEQGFASLKLYFIITTLFDGLIALSIVLQIIFTLTQ